MPNPHFHLSHFTVAGINYRKSDVVTRGKFFLSEKQCARVLQDSRTNFPGCFILSTCNRTEIYSITDDVGELIELLCASVEGDLKDFIEQGYVRQGQLAVEHLFKVTAGLDSQIIGDYEILSQVKRSVQLSKQHDCLNGFMEKVINFALQSSKAIKTHTRISMGTVSVSYAAIELIRQKVKHSDNKKILVIGTGKFGNVVGKNLKMYLPGCSLYFSNRTNEKAVALALECSGVFIPYSELPVFADTADIIVVSTSAESYTVKQSYFNNIKERLILDLSIPQNVDPFVKTIEGVELFNVDQISVLLEQAMSARAAEYPAAMQIVNDTLVQLVTWCNEHAHNRMLRTVKNQLNTLPEVYPQALKPDRIHKTVSILAKALRSKNNKGCQCIQAINNYVQFDYETAC